MRAIRIEAYGNPAEILKVVDLPDVGAPAALRYLIENRPFGRVVLVG
jgi:hypothetical protein